MDLLHSLPMSNQGCLEVLLQTLLSVKDHRILMPWLLMNNCMARQSP
ncbi:hypothetical protein [Synechococcus sp. CBW1006]